MGNYVTASASLMNLLSSQELYLFPEIGRRVAEFKEQNPELAPYVLSAGIGNTKLPLAQCIIDAGKSRLDEMGTYEGYAGYPPESGLPELREAVSAVMYAGSVDPDSIFISTGSKEDAGSIGDIFGNMTILVTDPAYPVYVDTNIMYGRNNIEYINCTGENGFVPKVLKDRDPCLIWLCNPNNPTGQCMTYDQLKSWVDYANRTGSIILYDNAYGSFIREEGYPASIFEVDSAQSCTIEFCSFSKSHGFTGIRVAWVAFGSDVRVKYQSEALLASELWDKRQAYRTNGVSRPLQAMALAALSPEGMKSSCDQTDYYLNNAKILGSALDNIGIEYIGGVNSPYLFMKTWDELGSWAAFGEMLKRIQVISTPAVGFGPCGEGYCRLSAFGILEDMQEIASRIPRLIA